MDEIDESIEELLSPIRKNDYATLSEEVAMDIKFVDRLIDEVEKKTVDNDFGITVEEFYNKNDDKMTAENSDMTSDNDAVNDMAQLVDNERRTNVLLTEHTPQRYVEDGVTILPPPEPPPIDNNIEAKTKITNELKNPT